METSEELGRIWSEVRCVPAGTQTTHHMCECMSITWIWHKHGVCHSAGINTMVISYHVKHTVIEEVGFLAGE